MVLQRTERFNLAICAAWALASSIALAGEPELLRIGDASAWTFFNGGWQDGSAGALNVKGRVLSQNGPAIQGHHYAFYKDKAYRDLRATFEIRLVGLSDVGLIFRAASPRQFSLILFPNCGQASRAQHFWAALARMDPDGYIRMAKLDMVNRVTSSTGVWLPVVVEIQGDLVRVQIGESGLFEARDDTFAGPGRVGAFVMGGAGIRNVRIEGDSVDDVPWDESLQPRKNWSYPVKDTTHGRWQRPKDLVRTPGGDLLLSFLVQPAPFSGKITPFFTRSRDNGRTWSAPYEAPTMGKPIDAGGNQWQWGRIHVFPDGQLRMLGPGAAGGYALRQTNDDGLTWSEPEQVKMGPVPEGLAPADGISQPRIGPHAMINLQDGAVLLLAHGTNKSKVAGANVWQWSSFHCQGYTARSTDNGRTWSDWVNIDGAESSPGAKVGGSLDLTEVCGIQRADGRIFALIRPVYSPWMWEASSEDSGKSWRPLVRGPFAGYATPNMLRTQASAVLCAHRLPQLTMHTSLDDARTFDQGTLIDSGLWAMGSMLEVEPNVVLYGYWDSYMTRMRAQFIRVTSKGIVPAPEYRDGP